VALYYTNLMTLVALQEDAGQEISGKRRKPPEAKKIMN